MTDAPHAENPTQKVPPAIEELAEPRNERPIEIVKEPEVVEVEDVQGTVVWATLAAVLLAIMTFFVYMARDWKYEPLMPPAVFTPTSGRMYVLTVPPEAEVLVNGRRKADRTPYIDNEVPLGTSIELTVRKPGYKSETRRFSLTAKDHMEGYVFELELDGSGTSP